MLSSEVKYIFALIAIAISLFGYIPYLKDTFSGKTKPHIFSWLSWTLVSYIIFGIQISNGAGIGSLTNLFLGSICLIITVRSFLNGLTQITYQDIIALLLTGTAITFWVFIKEPIVSVLLITLVDFFSFFPTIRKS